jgi:hypothetical protein
MYPENPGHTPPDHDLSGISEALRLLCLLRLSTEKLFQSVDPLPEGIDLAFKRLVIRLGDSLHRKRLQGSLLLAVVRSLLGTHDDF